MQLILSNRHPNQNSKCFECWDPNVEENRVVLFQLFNFGEIGMSMLVGHANKTCFLLLRQLIQDRHPVYISGSSEKVAKKRSRRLGAGRPVRDGVLNCWDHCSRKAGTWTNTFSIEWGNGKHWEDGELDGSVQRPGKGSSGFCLCWNAEQPKNYVFSVKLQPILQTFQNALFILGSIQNIYFIFCIVLNKYNLT